MTERITQKEVNKITAEKLARQKADRYRRLFAGDNGKLVLEHLKDFCGQEKTSVAKDAPDPYQTMYCEGKRRVFLHIMAMINRKDEE